MRVSPFILRNSEIVVLRLILLRARRDLSALFITGNYVGSVPRKQSYSKCLDDSILNLILVQTRNIYVFIRKKCWNIIKVISVTRSPFSRVFITKILIYRSQAECQNMSLREK